MPLDVIGAGLGRTGTRSLKDALERLGFARCYHMTDLFGAPEGAAHWEDAAAGRPVDWEALFDGYRAVVDYPGARHWRQLAARYPRAKVILTVRDPDEWYESSLQTIYAASQWHRVGPVFELVHRTIWQGDFDGRFLDREFSIEKFEQHNEDVRASVPPDRLLVYSVDQGWDPLCAFLGVRVPDEPFPKRNTSEEFTARLREMRTQSS